MGQVGVKRAAQNQWIQQQLDYDGDGSSPKPRGEVLGSKEGASHLEKEFLTIREASDYLNLKRSRLYSLVESAQIPHFKIGHLVRFRKSEIDHWLESHRIAPKDHANLGVEDFAKDPTADIVNNIVEKAIEEVTGKRYTSPTGKPERVKGLRKEVEHVSQ